MNWLTASRSKRTIKSNPFNLTVDTLNKLNEEKTVSALPSAPERENILADLNILVFIREAAPARVSVITKELAQLRDRIETLSNERDQLEDVLDALIVKSV